MAKSNRVNRAKVLHDIASELGVDPELVGVCAKGIPATQPDAIKDAVKAWLDAEAAKATSSEDAPKKEKGPKKASLTLSQRRALLKLQVEPQRPTTGFKALPYEYLASVGLVEKDDEGVYSLTDAGVARAGDINPLYIVWSAGESVCGDKNRPEAGTARAAKYDGSKEAATA